MVGLPRVVGSLPQNVSILLQMSHDGVLEGKGRRFSCWPPLAVLERHSYPWYMDCVPVSGLFSLHRPGLHYSWIMLITGFSKTGRDCLDPLPKRSILSPWPAAKNVDLFKWIILVPFQGTLPSLTYHLWAQPNKNLIPLLEMLRADSQEPTLCSLTI